MTAWVLALLVLMQPQATWRATYEATAGAIAEASVQSPLFAGADGPAKTAALLVSVSWFEARYNPVAVGDNGHSHGLFQASRVPVVDVEVQVRGALAAMRESFRICGSRRAEDWLAFYASGSCTNAGGILASRHRMGLAMKIWREHPYAI